MLASAIPETPFASITRFGDAQNQSVSEQSILIGLKIPMSYVVPAPTRIQKLLSDTL